MNLDELKSTWKAYDRKLQTAQMLNEKLIVSMITDRSSSRFSKVRLHYIIGSVWMMICLSFGILILFTNPFDYTYTIQYLPIFIFCVCLVILLAGLLKAYSELRMVTLDQTTLSESLIKIIALYEKPNKFLNYTVIVFLTSQVVLFPFSFLPKNIETMGLWTALAERLIPISIAALMLFVAYKLGAFKDSAPAKFKQDLTELEELKAISMELKES